MRSHHRFTECIAVTAQHPAASTMQTTRAQESLSAISTIHRHAAEQLVAWLMTAQRLEQTVATTMPLTPTQTVVLDQLKRELVWSLLTIVQKGGVSVIDALNYRKPVVCIGVETQQHIEQVVHLYLQHVQTILRR